MARKERPLPEGPLRDFAAGLRALREETGQPTYRELSRRANYSRSALSAAAGGEAFPTRELTLAYVRACGGDADAWRSRWADTAAALQAARSDAGSGAPPAVPPAAAPPAVPPAGAPPAVPPSSAAHRSSGVHRSSAGASATARSLRLSVRAWIAVAAAALIFAAGFTVAVFIGERVGQASRPPSPARTTATSPARSARPTRPTRSSSPARPTRSSSPAGSAGSAGSAQSAQSAGPSPSASIAPVAASGPGASAPGPASSYRYDQTTGPGCRNPAYATVNQDDSSSAHHWSAATAAQWTVPNCSDQLLYSAPSTETNPDEWQDDYEWIFYAVPTTVPCTFYIYVPVSPDASYTTSYFWTPGTTNYIDANAFTIDQGAQRGTWYRKGPFTFSSGKAMLEITDARSNVPRAPLAAAAVSLTCK